jgi:hypothetical protein
MANNRYSNNDVFDILQSTSPDKTMVNLFGPKPERPGSKDVHKALQVAGLAPGYGTIADAADAFLYITEGEFGEAAWSGAAAVPLLGQFVTSRRALKQAKEAGEEFITMWRGVDKWHKGSMVKKGKFIGGGTADLPNKPNSTWLTDDKRYASELAYSEKSVLLEFDVPKKWLDENFIKMTRVKGQHSGVAPDGIPKEFIKKVHWGKDI